MTMVSSAGVAMMMKTANSSPSRGWAARDEELDSSPSCQRGGVMFGAAEVKHAHIHVVSNGT